MRWFIATAAERDSVGPAVDPTPARHEHHRDAARGTYSGPDRRKPVGTGDLRTEAWRTLAGVTVAIALWMGAATLAARNPASRSLAISLSHGMTGALLLTSAALALAVWRITGTSRAACATIGLTLAGVSAPVMGILSRAVNSGAVRRDLVETLAGITELAVLACVAAAFALPAVATWLRPLRLAGPAVAVCLLAVSVILGVDGAGGSDTLLTDAAATLRIGNLALWLAVAAAFLARGARGARRRRAADTALGLAALIPAAGAAGKLLIGPVNFQTRLLPTGLQLATACLIAGAATVALWRLHTASGTRLLRVSGQLRETRTDLADLQSDQEQRLHDARNAIFAIAGATQLLAHPSDISGADADNLHQLVVAELNRLGQMLDPTIHAAPQSFSTTSLLAPIVAAYRAQGMTITADIDDCTLHTQRDSLANAIANLLTNARVHAPGARVWLSARETVAPDGVALLRITIADDGPGIPACERDAVLRPGTRGSGVTAPGSGLGLASAARMVAQLGGSLRLAEREGGGTSVTLAMPAARDTVKLRQHA